jgi:hypothetical protein
MTTGGVDLLRGWNKTVGMVSDFISTTIGLSSATTNKNKSYSVLSAHLFHCVLASSNKKAFKGFLCSPSSTSSIQTT